MQRKIHGLGSLNKQRKFHGIESLEGQGKIHRLGNGNQIDDGGNICKEKILRRFGFETNMQFSIRHFLCGEEFND